MIQLQFIRKTDKNCVFSMEFVMVNNKISYRGRINSSLIIQSTICWALKKFKFKDEQTEKQIEERKTDAALLRSSEE